MGSLLEPLERNLYTYAENDPVNYSDPSGRTGASTGNGYVERNTGSGGNAGYSYYGGSSGSNSSGRTSGNTSYCYVKYNREPSYKLTIGGTTRYYHTEAERNTARKVCEIAERINKGEKVLNPNPTAAAILAELVATTVVVLTGGAAAPIVGALGLEGFGAAVVTTTITGTIGGATEIIWYRCNIYREIRLCKDFFACMGTLSDSISFEHYNFSEI